MNTRKLAKILEESIQELDFESLVSDAVKDAIKEIDFEDVVNDAIENAVKELVESVSTKSKADDD